MYKIGDIVQDLEGRTGIVCVNWSKHPKIENGPTHYHKIGHWPKDTFVEATERERRLGTQNKSRK